MIIHDLSTLTRVCCFVKHVRLLEKTPRAQRTQRKSFLTGTWRLAPFSTNLLELGHLPKPRPPRPTFWEASKPGLPHTTIVLTFFTSKTGSTVSVHGLGSIDLYLRRFQEFRCVSGRVALPAASVLVSPSSAPPEAAVLGPFAWRSCCCAKSSREAAHAGPCGAATDRLDGERKMQKVLVSEVQHWHPVLDS